MKRHVPFLEGHVGQTHTLVTGPTDSQALHIYGPKMHMCDLCFVQARTLRDSVEAYICTEEAQDGLKASLGRRHYSS